MRHGVALAAVLVLSVGLAWRPGAGARSEEAKAPRKQEDPLATRLLTEARAARATWVHFPGFLADVRVNIDGKVCAGKVAVDAKGKVHLDLADPAASEWARRSLASIVGHRLPGSDQATPCFFEDSQDAQPLGRAIQVVDDEFHSSYRIRDRQILVVNRTARDERFTITVLENQVNADKQFLPAHYVVNSWNAKSGQLVRSEAYRQTWQRVGQFDLPQSVLVVTASTGNQEAKELTLSHLRLPAAAVGGP